MRNFLIKLIHLSLFLSLGVLIFNIIFLEDVNNFISQTSIKDKSKVVSKVDLRDKKASEGLDLKNSSVNKDLDKNQERDDLEELGVSFHLSGKESTSKDLEISLDDQKKIIAKTLSILPDNHRSTLNNLTIKFDENMRRGYGSGTKITLRGSGMTENVLVAVLIHELGHSVDLGLLSPIQRGIPSNFSDGKNSIYITDPSLDFYSISWRKEKVLKKDARSDDFVSGYSKTDCFEDFAETYAYYVLHGDDFRFLAKKNKKLAQKYEFLKTRVFFDKEYSVNSDLIMTTRKRPFDVTKLDFDLEEFFKLEKA